MSILDPASDDEAHLKKENPGVLFLIALMALFFWMLVPHLYLHATGSLPAPATQDNSHISPRQLSIAMTIMPLAGLLALIAGNLLYRDRPLKRLGVTSRHLKSALPRAAIAILIILPLIFGVGFATEWFFRLIDYAHPTEHDVLRAIAEDHSPGTRITLIASAVLFAPLFEEFMFRGMLQSAALAALIIPGQRPARLQRWAAILFASILFTAVHGQLWMMPPIFVLSLGLGYAYDRTQNLWVPILVHAAFNATEVILFLSIRP